MGSFIDWLAGTASSQAIQNLLWIVPAVQTVHLVAVAAVLSSVLMIGLRLLGRGGRFLSLDQAIDRYLPWIWGGLVVLALTGAVLIVGEPARTLGNPAFWIKMALLAMVLVAALVLRHARRRAPSPWEGRRWQAGPALRLAVGVNFVLWCGVAIAGRWIAYVTT